MSFSHQTRDDALSACARHCCVCRRYAGLHMEIHHIVPRSEGGEDSFENAIPLCFDCHCAAGHYNSKHPKGLRYSRGELHKARTSWYDLVSKGGIPTGPDRPVRDRFLLALSSSATQSLLDGVPDALLVEKSRPLVVKTPLSKLISKARKRFVSAAPFAALESVGPGAYADANAYCTLHPDARVTAHRGGHPSLWHTRPVSPAELAAMQALRNPSVQGLLDGGFDPLRDLIWTASNQFCGDGEDDGPPPVRETLSRPDVVDVFMCLTPLEPLELFGSSGSLDAVSPFKATAWDDRMALPTPHVERFPPVALPAEKPVIFPVGTLVRCEPGEEVTLASWAHELEFGQRTERLLDASGARFFRIGPWFLPETILTSAGTIPIHRLDPERVYALDEFLEIGCCPHLFFCRDRRLEYAGELFWTHPGKIVDECVWVQPGVTDVVIAELEHEVTTIHEIAGCGAVSREMPVVLVHGASVTIRVRESGWLRIRGEYHCRGPIFHQATPSLLSTKSRLVRRFIHANHLG
jgi:hypothetical protein